MVSGLESEQPAAQLLAVGDDDLLGAGVGVEDVHVDAQQLQQVVHQRAAGRDRKRAVGIP